MEIWIWQKIKSHEHDPADEDVDMVKDVVRTIDFEMSIQAVADLDAVADDLGDRPVCLGAQGDGKWVKVRKGITIDSGSAAFVMLETWLPGFETQESPGSRKGT